jgi:hypothetical protein
MAENSKLGKGEEVYGLAAFGKHPGWDDHIDDIGLDTEELVRAKQQLYHNGLASQIDAGAWEQLAESGRLEGFDHVLVWRQKSVVVLGRMMSSSDGKGRTRYPMVVCAQLPIAGWIHKFGPTLAKLDAVMAGCGQTSEAEVVRTVVELARSELPSLAAMDPPASVPLADISAGMDDESVVRVLYQVRNQLGAWAPAAYDANANSVGSASLRLPTPSSDEVAGLLSWLDFFDSQLNSAAPLLLVLPRQGSWIDVIVGEAESADFFCLRAGLTAIPAAHEIPFTIDDEFREEVAPVVEALRSSARAPVSLLAGLTPAKAPRPTLTQIRSKLDKKMVLIAAGVAVLVSVGLILLLSGKKSTPTTVAVEVMDESDWAVLCRGYYNWFGSFQGQVREKRRTEAWQVDKLLATEVIQVIEEGSRELGDFDPRVLAGVKRGGLMTLADSPPESLADEQVRSAVHRAAKVMAQVDTALKKWTALPATQKIIDRLAGFGAETATGEAKTALAAKLGRDDRLMTEIDARLRIKIQLEQIDLVLVQLEQNIQKLDRSEDPLLIEVASSLARELGSENLSNIKDRGTQLIQLTGPVVAALSDSAFMATIDRNRFQAERSPPEFSEPSNNGNKLIWWAEEILAYHIVASDALREVEKRWDDTMSEGRLLAGQARKLESGSDVSINVPNFDELARGFKASSGPIIQKDFAGWRAEKRQLTANLASAVNELRSQVANLSDPSEWKRQMNAIAFSSSIVIEAEWSLVRGKLIERLEQDSEIQSIVSIRVRAESWLKFFEGLVAVTNETIPPVEGRGTRSELWGDLEFEIQEGREALSRELLSLESGKMSRAAEENPPEFPSFEGDPRVKKLLSEKKVHQVRLERVVSDWTKIRQKLNSGAVWQGELQSLYSDTNKGLPTLNIGPDSSLSALRMRMNNLEKLARETQPGLLIDAGNDSDLSQARTAWLALSGLPNWPMNFSDLKNAMDLAQHIEGLSKDKTPEDLSSNRLQENIRHDLKAIWHRAFEQITGERELEAVLIRAEDCHIGLKDMSPAERHATKVLSWKQSPWPAMAANELEVERKKILTELNLSDKNGIVGAKKLADELAELSLKEETVDYTSLGPGGKNWELVSEGNRDHLIYAWKNAPSGKEYRLGFTFVQPDDSLPAYVATDELPIGLVLEWVEAQGPELWEAWFDAQLNVLEEMQPANADRLGPRSYVLGSRKSINSKRSIFEVSTEWLTHVNKDYYVDQPPPDNPSVNTPLNYISPAAAQVLSEAFGAKLPSVAEWLKASRTVLDAENTRDQSWLRQKQHVANLKDKRWPDSDIFTTSNPGVKKTNTGSEPIVILVGPQAKVAESVEDDGWLWFSPVPGGSSEKFRNMIGNVAEYVVDEAGQVLVIGSSALSSPELNFNTPYPINELDKRSGKGYSDVGIRLAFTLGHLSPGHRMQRMIAAVPLKR